jgi:hypothetical protein
LSVIEITSRSGRRLPGWGSPYLIVSNPEIDACCALLGCGAEDGSHWALADGVPGGQSSSSAQAPTRARRYQDCIVDPFSA